MLHIQVAGCQASNHKAEAVDSQIAMNIQDEAELWLYEADVWLVPLTTITPDLLVAGWGYSSSTSQPLEVTLRVSRVSLS